MSRLNMIYDPYNGTHSGIKASFVVAVDKKIGRTDVMLYLITVILHHHLIHLHANCRCLILFFSRDPPTCFGEE